MNRRFGMGDREKKRKWLDTTVAIFILGLVFSCGVLYAQFFDLKDEVARMEQHLNSVDAYAHHRRP